MSRIFDTSQEIHTINKIPKAAVVNAQLSNR